ncbi:hypothetical protein C8R45DRAFT_100953 [Mycena sanguinolenta]|nr:hypothetical protein C8R45DRAFT_100953 [Mycena sanguinolenta]
MLGRLSSLFTPPNARVMASMRWETFLELMRTEGFRIEDEPSTSGSVVRFYPPNSDDESIIFHKPHPDPTITPQLLREFANKLKRKYEWIDTDFILLSAEMPWHTFVKLMREKGFQCHPADFGSSVRFDPPNPKDVVSAKLSSLPEAE